MEALILLAMLYFIPAVVASLRRHRNRTPIFLTNALLGWTLIGWIGALIWASTADVEPPAPPSPTSGKRQSMFMSAEQWGKKRTELDAEPPPAAPVRNPRGSYRPAMSDRLWAKKQD